MFYGGIVLLAIACTGYAGLKLWIWSRKKKLRESEEAVTEEAYEKQ